MLMVIFGAGASYDSVPSRPPTKSPYSNLDHRPPLADQLFADRELFTNVMQRFPKCQPIIPYLRRQGVSVEQELERLRGEAAEYPERLRQLAAVRFYLHFMLTECQRVWDQDFAKGITNYKTLLDLIERWRKKDESVCLVTFNYDTLLENALPAVGIGISSLSDYIGSSIYKVVKLHGSVDWGRVVKAAIDVYNLNEHQVANQLVERAPELVITDEYRRVRQHPIAKEGQVALFPAIAIPVQEKAEYECPPDHLKALHDFLPKVSRLMVIGWRAAETRFLQLLAKYSPRQLKVMIVGGSSQSADEVAKRLQTAEVIKEGRILRSTFGFTRSVESREAEEFLRLER